MASISWKTGTSGGWTTSANWSPAAVPGINDDVTVAASGNYTVSIVTSVSARTLTINAAGATVTDSGTLSLGSTMSIQAGQFLLNNSTISGGTINVSGGSFVVNGGTMSNVTYQGTLNVTGASVNLSIAGGLHVTQASGSGAGTVNLTGTGAIMGFLGSQTFDSATVNLGGPISSTPARLIERDTAGTGATLTLGSSLTVLSNGGYGFLQSADTAANDGLVNAGTIAFGTSGGLIQISSNTFVNQGLLSVSHGGTLDVLTGPYALSPGEIGRNSGSITISSGLLAFANSFTNTGSIVATGGTVTIAGTFVTTGTFQANNTHLTIGGTISGGSLLALLNNTSDTVSYTAVYDNTGAVLNVGSGTAIGTLSLTSSLPIRNGTIADAGGGFIFNGGTLTNVAYQGTIDLSRNGASLNIATNLVSSRTGGGGPGAVKLTGTSSQLNFIGSQTFNSSTITMGSSVRTSFAKLVERDSAGTGTTLTLGSSLLVTANSGVGVILSVDAAANDGLVNQGTIQAATSGGLVEISANHFTNTGKLLVGTGGTVDVLTGPYTPAAGESGSSSGSITDTGGLLGFGGTFVNTGSITVSGGTLTLAGTFTDAGSLQVNNATVNLGGVFSGVSLLGVLNNASDTVTVTGTYDNTGATLQVGAGTALGSIDLIASLPILGGTIVDSGGGLLYDGGTLDGVTYVGTMTLGAGDDLDVADGLVVQNGSNSAPGIVNLTGGFSILSLLDTQSLDNLTINIGDSSLSLDGLYNDAAGTVTFGAHVLVQQTIGLGQIYDAAVATTVNQGSIAVSGGFFEVYGNGGSFTNAGTIQVSNGATVAADAFLGDSNFTNTGLLSASGGADLVLEVGWSNTGTISVNQATLQLGSDTTSAWQSIGTIVATNSTLLVEGALTTAQLNQLSLSGDLTQIIGELDNSAGVLTVGAGSALGALTLAGGTIEGGTIADSGGGILFGTGTLDGVTYKGTLAVGGGGQLWVLDGLTLLPGSGSGAGRLTLTGGGSGLLVQDSETLNNATITVGDASSLTDYIESLIPGGPGTLTLGSQLLIQQSTGDAAVYTAGGGTTVNNGRIVVSGGTFHVDYGTFLNAGTISVTGTGAQFNDNLPGFTNSGLLTASGGAGIALLAGWSNTGTISVSGGADLRLGSDTTTAWGTIGTIIASGATLDLYGAFTTAQLLSLSLSSDTANLEGVLNNAGATLAIGTGTALTSFDPLAGGILRGGVVADAGGGLIAGGGTLDGVTYRGALSVGGGATLNVVDGLTLQSGGGGSPGSLALIGGGSTLLVLDTETLNNATVLIGDASGTTDILSNGGANGNTLTLGSNLVLLQSAGSAQLLSNGSADVTINRGQITVSTGTLDISGGNFSNAGTISVSGGGEVMFEPGVLSNLANATLTGGVYVVGAGSTIELQPSTSITSLAADLTLNGPGSVVQSLFSSGSQIGIDGSLRTIAVAGALRLLSARSLSVPGALLDQGLLQLAGGTVSTSSTLTVSGTLFGYGTVVGGLSDGGLVEANGGRLSIVNITSGSGQLQVDAGATLELVTNSALSSNLSGSGATLLLDKPGTYTGTIGGFSLGDTIVLAGVTATSASITSGTLTVNLSTGGTLTYAVSGSFSGLAVRTANVGGNVNVTLASAAPTQITGLYDNRGNTLTVGGGTSVTLDGGTVLGGTIADSGGGFVIGFGTLDGVAYLGTIVVGPAGLLNVVDGLTVQTLSGGNPGTITLTGGGSTLAVGDSETLNGATILIGDSSGTTDILSNGGPNGNTLTLGSNLIVQQTTGSAQILANGTSDVTVNQGQIVVSGGTLDISGGSFSNAGTINVSGGGEVMFEAGAFANFASSTLTGGVYVVGAGSTLELAKSNFIATLSADLTLSGAGSTLQALNSSNVQTAIDSTMHTISTSGILRLLSGRSLAEKSAFLIQGVLQMGGGTLSDTSTTTIAGALVGYGTLTGSVSNNGLIEANGGRLTITNIATGTGRLQVDAGATLELATTDALASSFNGAGGTLLLDKPGTYTGTIGGFAVGETIVLASTTASSASIVGNTLTVNLTNGGTLSYAVTGSFAGLTVHATTVGGNTNVTLTSGGSDVRAAALAAPSATPIAASQLSLAQAGFLDASGRLAGHVVAATTSGQTLTATSGIRDVFTGTAATLDHDTITGFGGTGAAADMIDVRDIAFATVTAKLATGPSRSILSLGDGTHAASLTLLGGITASHLTMMNDGHGGTLFVHR